MFSLLRSHLDFPEYVLMAVFYRFIHNLEVAIKDKKSYFSNLGKIFWGGGGSHLKVKLRAEACHLDFQNIFQNRLCWKSCYEIFIK